MKLILIIFLILIFTPNCSSYISGCNYLNLGNQYGVKTHMFFSNGTCFGPGEYNLNGFYGHGLKFIYYEGDLMLGVISNCGEGYYHKERIQEGIMYNNFSLSIGNIQFNKLEVVPGVYNRTCGEY
jgi:hypothetical protein